MNFYGGAKAGSPERIVSEEFSGGGEIGCFHQPESAGGEIVGFPAERAGEVNDVGVGFEKIQMGGHELRAQVEFVRGIAELDGEKHVLGIGRNRRVGHKKHEGLLAAAESALRLWARGWTIRGPTSVSSGNTNDL